MDLHIVNPDSNYPRASLVDATTLGYLYLAATVRPPRWLPFPLPSAKRTHLLKRLKDHAYCLKGQRSDYVIVNWARRDGGALRHFFHQLSKRSYWRYVVGNLEANRAASMPVYCRMAYGLGLQNIGVARIPCTMRAGAMGFKKLIGLEEERLTGTRRADSRWPGMSRPNLRSTQQAFFPIAKE
jgi:hypothetical protein